jgi:hypothetical protein
VADFTLPGRDFADHVRGSFGPQRFCLGAEIAAPLETLMLMAGRPDDPGMNR